MTLHWKQLYKVDHYLWSEMLRQQLWQSHAADNNWSRLFSICILVCTFVPADLGNIISPKCPSSVLIHLQTFYCCPLCLAQSAIFRPGKSVELKVLPGENCWSRGVRPLPYITLLMRTCLTLPDQYFRKLLLVSLPISQDDKDVIVICVYVGVWGLS